MKLFAFFLLSFLSISTAFAQSKNAKITQPNADAKIDTVQASCGECKLGLKGKSCDLAVKINGTSYFVNGTHINDHGDAHENDGFCNAIRSAAVQGSIVNDRFKATYFKLLPMEKKKD